MSPERGPRDTVRVLFRDATFGERAECGAEPWVEVRLAVETETALSLRLYVSSSLVWGRALFLPSLSRGGVSCSPCSGPCSPCRGPCCGGCEVPCEIVRGCSSSCGATGSATSLQGQEAGSIPGPARWVKDLDLALALRCRLHLWLGAESWPGTSIGHGAKEEKGKKTRERIFVIPHFALF